MERVSEDKYEACPTPFREQPISSIFTAESQEFPEDFCSPTDVSELVKASLVSICEPILINSSGTRDMD